MNITVAEIIRKYLEDNGFGGLFCADVPCGCGTDDLIPCGEPGTECEAGYKKTCDKCDDNVHEYCDLSDAAWCITRAKPEEAE